MGPGGKCVESEFCLILCMTFYDELTVKVRRTTKLLDVCLFLYVKVYSLMHSRCRAKSPKKTDCHPNQSNYT